jgi:hypothetical protein
MTTKLSKSLADLIDETLAEIEELKKSDRFSAEEIELGEKSAQGEMAKGDDEERDEEDEEDEKEEEAKKAEDEDEDEAEDEEDDEEEAKKAEAECEKAEAEMAKAEEECEKAEAIHLKALKKRDMCKADLEHKMKKKSMHKADWAKKSEGVNLMVKEEKEMKKSLAKSIEARISPLEAKLSQVLDVVKQIADTPLPQRGHTYRQVQPLAKSANDVEPLNKSAVLNKLLDLKKTGTDVDAADVVRVEVGGTGDLHDIANKYGIK